MMRCNRVRLIVPLISDKRCLHVCVGVCVCVCVCVMEDLLLHGRKISITQHQPIKQIMEKWNVVDYLAEIPVNLIWYLKLIRFCMAKLNWVSNMSIYHEVSKNS